MGSTSTDPGYGEEDIKECHKILENQASLKPPVQKETVREKVRDLLGKFKAGDGFWECDTCMVRNSNDKLVCVAPAQPQNLEVKHHKCQLIEGHHLFHSAQLLLHGIQASPLDLLHLMLMLDGFAPASSQGFS